MIFNLKKFQISMQGVRFDSFESIHIIAQPEESDSDLKDHTKWKSSSELSGFDE